jgi:hypothetical protein
LVGGSFFHFHSKDSIYFTLLLGLCCH